MQLRYDEDLVEAAVLLSASARRQGIPALQIARFHRQREKLYSILDPEERNSAFFKLHLDWFCEWGLAKLLTESVREFAILQTSLTFLIIRKSRVKSDDGTELYVNEASERTRVMALRSEFLVTKTNVDTFLRHELM